MADAHAPLRWAAAQRVAVAESLASLLLPAALALSLLALLWRLFAEPFDHGYTRYASIAAEMIRSGDWIVQRHDGQLYFDKPPLQMWLIAIAMRLWGSASGWVQHVPNAIGLLAALGFTYSFGLRWFGQRRAALSACLVLATCLGFVFLVRDKRIDPLFSAWLTGSFYFAYRFLVDAESRRERWSGALAAAALLLLATLTKGPLALLFFAFVVGPFALWTGRLRRLASLESLAGGALLLVLLAPWPILVVRELGLAQTLEVLRATEMTTRTGGPLYYLRELPLRFLPWSLLLPAAGVWLVKARPERESPALRFILCWVLGVLIPLHLSGGKHYRYLLPLFPALALLVVALWHLSRAQASAAGAVWRVRLEAFGVGALLACLVAVSVLSPIAAWLKPEWRVAGSAAALALIAVGLAALHGLRRLRRDRVRAFETALAALAAAVAIYDGARALELSARGATSEAALAALAPIAHGVPARSLGLGSGQRDALLLATLNRVEPSRDAEDVASWLRGAGRGFVLTDEQGATQLEQVGGVAVQRRENITLANVGLVFMELTASAATSAPEAGARAD